jgi:hypothetical protein
VTIRAAVFDAGEDLRPPIIVKIAGRDVDAAVNPSKAKKLAKSENELPL